MVKTGVVFGRYQVFHLRHMECILAAKMRCQKLYIGITHPDIVSYAATSAFDINGTTRRDNPLTYFERFDMIQQALLDFGVKREEFEIIPFPVSQPDLILQYAPADAVYYMSICDAWDEEQRQILQQLGITTEILWRRSEEEKGITGTAIRKLIGEDGDWQQHVPKTVGEYITEHGIDRRIQKLQQLYAPPERITE